VPTRRQLERGHGVAFDAGYETHEAFTRAFRACYSTSPSGFRQRRHPRIEIVATCGVHFSTGGQFPPFIPRDSGGQNMNVEIKDMPELRVGTVRHVGPYNQIPNAFERLHTIVHANGFVRRADTMMLAIYHDDPESVPQDELRSDAGITIPQKGPLPDGLVEQRLAAGRYASTLHVGPYEKLGDAWARFMGEWLPASGHRLGTGASYELYHNDPSQVPKEQLRTELFISIA
jgi:AraC family transcriptional regulator